jgi:hypothetical protein
MEAKIVDFSEICSLTHTLPQIRFYEIQVFSNFVILKYMNK